MTDFIEGLQDDLVDAARRQQQARNAAVGARRRVSGRTLAVTAAGLVLAGSATAAIIGRDSEPSKPLAGPLAAESARDYRVEVQPDLRAGQVGWCIGLILRRSGITKTRGSGCFGSPTGRPPLLLSALGIYGREIGITVALATSDVPVIRLGARRVRTRADSSVPFGWRAAVQLLPGQAPADPGQAPANPGLAGVPVAENAEGTPLPIRVLTENVRGTPTRKVSASDRKPRCSLGTAEGFEAIYTRAAIARPDTDATPATYPSYFSCTYTTFRVRGGRARLTAAILEPAPSVGPVAAPRARGLAVSPLRDAWLVVTGGNAEQRRALLTRLHPRVREN